MTDYTPKEGDIFMGDEHQGHIVTSETIEKARVWIDDKGFHLETVNQE